MTCITKYFEVCFILLLQSITYCRRPVREGKTRNASPIACYHHRTNNEMHSRAVERKTAVHTPTQTDAVMGGSSNILQKPPVLL